MKTQHLLSLFAVSVCLSACGTSNKPVAVAKTPETKTEFRPIQAPTVAERIQLPPKATAMCNDGSYSMSLLNEACLGNGGIKQGIMHYHSD